MESKANIDLLVNILNERFCGLIVCLSKSWGGLEQVAASDALDAANAGLKIKVLCLEGTPIHEHLAHRNELSLVPLDFKPRDFLDFKMRSEIHRLISQNVNVIHTHQTSLMGSIVPWIWNRPSISMFATRHMMSNHYKKNFYHRALYSRLDALIVMSETLKMNVLDTHPVHERKVKVVNLGLDFDRFDPDKVDPQAQRSAWGADDDTLVIGLVGRIDPAKGQSTFIRAAAGIMKTLRAGEKVKFVIVGEETLGSTSGFLGELKKMVSQFHLDEVVVFAGYQENIPEVMRAFDIFVMPSRQETFGLVAIEAMAMECPIIISSGGSAEEIVGKEEFGLTVRPEDAFDLQQQLRFLLDNPMKRMQMGKRGREHVVRNYDRRVRLRTTLELYERAVRRRAML